MNGRMRASVVGALTVALVAGVAGAALAQDASFEAQPGAVTLVSYSTPREAFEEIIPAFQATDAGAGVEFETSYGASGDQSRAVAAGLPADIVEFSLEPDITRLVDAGIVAPDWNTNATKGIVTDSVVVIVTRPGNPKNIQGWDDLIRDDVSVITPNPVTSGGARWNIMAAYGAQIKAGKTPEEALAFVTELFKHVTVFDKSARDSLQTFLAGQGDVLLSYENEAILAQQNGEDLPYIVPDATILIENPAAVTLNGDAPEAAKAFLDYLTGTDAQTIFGNRGYRPVVPEVAATFDTFPAPANLFTIADLGGWADVTKTFFDKTDGSITKILAGLGAQP
ncbi:MAG: sulfate ABC transporter substrate-binding protein [Chloroflexota bacterium]